MVKAKGSQMLERRPVAGLASLPGHALSAIVPGNSACRVATRKNTKTRL
jgi:hypothetical protein